jgi:hypothetical protein
VMPCFAALAFAFRAAAITYGPVFRAINRAGRVWGDGMSPKVLWGRRARLGGSRRHRQTSPAHLRRTCARLCHLAGGELDQIQFLLGHVSIHTTERYLGWKQKLRIAVNDRLGIEPDAALTRSTSRADASVRPARLLASIGILGRSAVPKAGGCLLRSSDSNPGSIP